MSKTDQELMREFQETLDESVFEELMSRYHRKAFTFARGILSYPDLVEDAVQDTFIRIVRKHHLYDCSQPFSPWFYRILRNTCFDHYRKHKCYFEKMREYAESFPANETGSRERLRLSELLVALSAQDREILTLHYVEGWTLKEVGQLLSCSEEAAKKRSQRAIKKLRDYLKQSKQDSGDHSPVYTYEMSLLRPSEA